MTRLCILTPALDYEEDWSANRAHFDALFGATLTYRPWTNPGDLSGFALILPLLTWGYQRDPALWERTLNSWATLPFANTISMLRWNTDKTYLFDLEAAGIRIVPSRHSPALTSDDVKVATAQFGDQIVIKPTISGGADGTYRLSSNDPIPADVTGRSMLLQPLMNAIATEGEYSLFLFDGVLSHAILKRPASGDFRVQEQFGGGEVAITPPDEASELATATLAVLPELPLYARIDMVRDETGAFCLMELEAIEPSLFLQHAPDKGAAFAAAVKARL